LGGEGFKVVSKSFVMLWLEKKRLCSTALCCVLLRKVNNYNNENGKYYISLLLRPYAPNIIMKWYIL